MMPSRPMCGRAWATSAAGSALSVEVLVAVIERVDLLLGERDGRAEGACQVDRAGRVLAHDGGLDGRARGRADGEDAVAAHQHGGRAMGGQRLDDGAADLLAADERERA